MKTQFNISEHIDEIKNVATGYFQAAPTLALAFGVQTNLAELAQQALSQRAGAFLGALSTEALYVIASGEFDLEAMLCRMAAGGEDADGADDAPPAVTSGVLSAIARETLGIATLETRKSDRLDFHEVSVWGLAAALRAAYDAGAACGPAPDDALRCHPNYHPADLTYLRAKGFDDARILAYWTDERARGNGPCAWDTPEVRDKWEAVVGKPR